MFTVDKQDKFIELRAQGWSFAHIASELHLSKRTVVDWSREFAKDIQSLRAAGLDLSRVRVKNTREEYLKRFIRLQKDAKVKLASYPTLSVTMDNIFRLTSKLCEEIKQALEERNALKQVPSPLADPAVPGEEQKP